MENLCLEPCPQCGKKVLIGYACGEYFIYSREKADCVCDNFTEMHSSECLEVSSWNEFVENYKEVAERNSGNYTK